MFTEPEAKKEANEDGTRKTTAAEGQFPASQGAEGKPQGRWLVQFLEQKNSLKSCLYMRFNKLTAVFYATVLLLIINSSSHCQSSCGSTR